ncbi:hypothetical protein [Bacillus haynesii]|uniref:hypothetical protein n=1 Tax=Bacillus haynesii TaxID=1925021 RepID=UPI00227F842E|nr:hypothetical protein [Bacillus haynesii]MCY8215905.1 hypothetical protein [Bacillus haynesii]MCY8611366.1 hypothetical protein [Bacillus haynesii]MEC1559598.1 hypothetical protein [Bacillus haynesii]
METSSATESVYLYQGGKFEDYICFDFLKTEILNRLKIQSDPTETYKDFYLRAIRESRNKKLVDSLVFENIFYGRLANIFSQKIEEERITEEQFKEKVKNLLNYFNENSALSDDLKRLMTSETNYYLMDQLNTTSLGTTFIAGWDIEVHNSIVTNARFLITKVIPTETKDSEKKVEYMVMGVEIDFVSNLINFHHKNIQNIYNDEDIKEIDKVKTLNKAYHYLSEIFIKQLEIKFKIDPDKDRAGMYNLFNKIINSMLKEVTDEVKRKVDSLNKENTKNVIKSLFNPSLQKLAPEKDLEERFLSIINALYIKVMLDENELIDIAKNLKLIGYPTRIAFTTEEFAKGSTGTSGSQTPIASSIMFHSLNPDLKKSLDLQTWTISWFKDFNHSNPINTEVVGTTIKCHKDYFHIVFLNKKYIGKELLKYVTNELSKYRNY